MMTEHDILIARETILAYWTRGYRGNYKGTEIHISGACTDSHMQGMVQDLDSLCDILFPIDF